MSELSKYRPRGRTVWVLLGCCVLAGVLLAALLYPVVGGAGLLVNRAATTVQNSSSELLDGTVPEVTTMTDTAGTPIARLYDQRRVQVSYDDISPEMIRAIISIEDKRFLDHDGVDWKGTIRAFLKNSSSGEVQQGASTLDQQYIKNYQLLVLARTDADREAAIATTPARKLREVRMALSMEQTLTDQVMRDKNIDRAAAKQEAKKEVVTRYLNIVPFGNGAYGIESAAQTYFGKSAKDLDATEAAMLAGMVQSSSTLNPFTNASGVTERRNLVLDTMKINFPDRAAELETDKSKPLGILKAPRALPQGCIASGDNGFFCDYALRFLAENGISRDTVQRGGYTIRTTLDPAVQKSTRAAVSSIADPELDGVANVMNVLKPGSTSHDLLAMASSRTYGLNQKSSETVQPQPYSMVGDGAGSIFKIFTVAAAMEKGLGTSANIDVPSFFEAKGMGSSDGANGCPENTYCVKNDGKYPSSMSITNALAQSPNTAFVKLLQSVGVPPAVDMAVKLGLRSYGQRGTSGNGDETLADSVKKGNFGSFTLGPNAVNPLELANVATTLSSHGKWCPPNPIASITQKKRDRYGNTVIGPNGQPEMIAVAFSPPKCEQVIDPGLADTLANALSADDKAGGTSAGSAGSTGWSLPVSAKTGTTETHRSSAFLGFTNHFAGASYIYGDGSSPGGICTSPLRSCGSGDLYGGLEPARTWYTAIKPIADKFGPTALPPTEARYVEGSAEGHIPDVAGLPAAQARQRIEERGFKVTEQTVTGSQSAGTVTGTGPSGSATPGSTVTMYVSNGQGAQNRGGSSGPRRAPTTIEIPGIGPIVIPGGR